METISSLCSPRLHLASDARKPENVYVAETRPRLRRPLSRGRWQTAGCLVPKRFLFQPVDTGEVAAELATIIHARRTRAQPDFDGPAIHNAEYLACSLLDARGKKRPILNLAAPSKTARAFKQGLHTNRDQAIGRVTEEFLGRRYPSGR